MTRRRITLIALGGLVAMLAAAPVLAPNDPWRQFPGHAYAPPMPPRVVANGELRPPFVYPVVVIDRLERRFEEDHQRPQPIAFFSGGRVASTQDGPWLLLGADSLGRDVFARLLSGGRLSIGVAAVAVFLTLAIGGLLGSLAASTGGRVDQLVTAVADFTIVLPMTYAVVTLRAAMPLTVSPQTVFWTMAVVMALATWPIPARGVRAIVMTERRKGYAEAAYAAGGSPLRILLRHLLPAAAGHIGIQGLLLFPAFIFAEATLSYVGLGFAEPSASWGVMLQEAARVSAMTEAPWLLSPAVAIVLTVLATRLLIERDDSPTPFTER